MHLVIGYSSLNVAKEKKEKANSGGIFSRSLFSRKSLRKNQHSGASTPVPPDSDSRFEVYNRSYILIEECFQYNYLQLSYNYVLNKLEKFNSYATLVIV